MTLLKAVQVIAAPKDIGGGKMAMTMDLFPIPPLAKPYTVEVWPELVIRNLDPEFTEFYAQVVGESGVLLPR